MKEVNCFDHDGNTPLHIAAWRGLIEVVTWLCEEKGAMLTVLNHDNLQAIHLAYIAGHENVVTYLEKKIALIGRNNKNIYSKSH